MAGAPPAPALARAADHLPLVLYDGECAFCRAQARRLRTVSGGRLRIEPLQTGLAHVPWVEREEAMRALHLIDRDGRAYVGAAAVVRALRLTRPVLGILALAYHLPGAGWLAERLYAAVATRRQGLPGEPACATGHCHPVSGRDLDHTTSTGRPAPTSVRSSTPPSSDSSQRE